MTLICCYYRAEIRSRFSDGPVTALRVLMLDGLRVHSVFLNGMRNCIFFPLKCNAFQAGFHGWLRGVERE